MVDIFQMNFKLIFVHFIQFWSSGGHLEVLWIDAIHCFYSVVSMNESLRRIPLSKQRN